MLDSWVSPEAAGFFISFTEGRNPLLPASPLHPMLRAPLSLSPSLPSTIFLASCSLLVENLNDTSDVSLTGHPVPPALPSGDQRSPGKGLGTNEGFDFYVFSLSPSSPHLGDCRKTYSPPHPPYFYRKKKKAGKESIWHMNN